MRVSRILSMMIILVLFMMPAIIAQADEVPRMTKEELKNLLGSSDLVIIDVRRVQDWNASEFKIKGSVRPDEQGIGWAKDYDKDKTMVLYCA